MIGIGLLCWRRTEGLRDILSSFIRTTESRYRFAVSCNSPEAVEVVKNINEEIGYMPLELLGSGKNLGVAGGKNRIFCWFKNNPDLDHLFLFEDDCWPIARGWDEWYRLAHRTTGTEVACFQPVDYYGGVTSHGRRSGNFEVVGTLVDGMMMLSATRRAVDEIGGMHRGFEGLVGQEHSEYVTRACRAHLCPFTNVTFVGCEEWLDGIDFQEWRHSKGLPGGQIRPAGDPAAHQLFKYEPGREAFFRIKKGHKIGELYQDPCWDEQSAREVTL